MTFILEKCNVMGAPCYLCWKSKNHFARKAMSMDVVPCLILLSDFYLFLWLLPCFCLLMIINTVPHSAGAVTT